MGDKWDFVLGGCRGGIVCHHFITEGLGKGISVVKGVIPYDSFSGGIS